MMFVVFAAFNARKSPRDALVGFTFFGVCALAAGFNIARKLRRRRFSATIVAAPGGVKLHGSNSRILLIAALIAVPGVTIFFVEAPLIIRICGGIMLGASAFAVVGVLTGRFSRRFLRFDRWASRSVKPGLSTQFPGTN